MATPPSTDEQSISAAGNGDRPKVEIGWILEGDMPGAQRDAVKAAAVSMEHALSDCMPRFDWVIETLERPAETDRGRIEPVRLLDAAEVDRDMRGWDFALVVTARQLHGRERSRVLGVTSSIFATAILSTAFLTSTDLDTGRTADRLHALAMHLFGQLNGLTADRSNTWMGRLGTADDLDGMGGFGDEALADLADRMKDGGPSCRGDAGAASGQGGFLRPFALAEPGRAAARNPQDAALELPSSLASPDDGGGVGAGCPRHDRRVLGGRSQSFVRHHRASLPRLADGHEHLSAEGPAPPGIPGRPAPRAAGRQQRRYRHRGGTGNAGDLSRPLRRRLAHGVRPLRRCIAREVGRRPGRRPPHAPDANGRAYRLAGRVHRGSRCILRAIRLLQARDPG